jgi:uncharacterized protein (DUF302 family)
VLTDKLDKLRVNDNWASPIVATSRGLIMNEMGVCCIDMGTDNIVSQVELSYKFDIERISIRSSKPFDAVVTALESAIGHPDMAEFSKSIRNSQTFAEVENTIHRNLGRTGLMIFAKFDLGSILHKETGLDTQIIRFDIGNPLIMKEMVKHVPEAGSYAPVPILVDERPDGVHLSYDKMASVLAIYRNSDALAIARDLDSKIENLLIESAS